MKSRAQEIAAALANVEDRITKAATAAGRNRSDLTLIAVTKTYPASDVQILDDLGVKNFGENRSD